MMKIRQLQRLPHGLFKFKDYRMDYLNLQKPKLNVVINKDLTVKGPRTSYTLYTCMLNTYFYREGGKPERRLERQQVTKLGRK
jgi:hypothetical protein